MEVVIHMIILAIVTSIPTASLLLDATSTSSLSTAHNVEQLLDLLLEEKQLRRQLAQQVDSLRIEVEANKWNTAASLGQLSNRTEKEFDRNGKELETLKQALEKEKANRRQLQQAYAHMKMELYNLTLANGALANENKYFEEQVLNLTKDGQRHKKECATFADSLNTSIAVCHAETSLLKTKLNNLTLIKDKLAEQVQNHTSDLMKDKQRLADINVVTTSLNSSVLKNYDELFEVRQKQGYQSGFTVQTPKAGPTNGSIVFTDIKSNIGNHYDATTGKFTCVYPGVYFFSISLYQAYTNHYTFCFIQRNGARLMEVSSDSGGSTDNAYFQASNNVFVHLNKGDVVNLYTVKPVTTMDRLTTFSGFMISSD